MLSSQSAPPWERRPPSPIPPTTTFEGKRQIQITSGASLIVVLLGPLFLVANVLAGHPGLACINAGSTLVGALCLWLVRRRRARVGAILLITGASILFTLSALYYRTGMEYTLLVAMLGAVFMFESAWMRIPLAAFGSVGFLVVKLHHLGPSETGDTSPGRYIANIVVFLLSYHTVLELLQRAYTHYHARLERANADLAESRRQLDEEHRRLLERTEELHIANEAKEKLFSIISHDLRDPIGGLKSAMEMVERGDLTSADFQELLPTLSASVGHAYECLDVLLVWSASQLRAIKPEPAEVPLARAIGDCIGLLTASASRKGIAISAAVPPGARVLVDKNHLLAIVRNLVANALKFTPSGGEITITATRETAHWRITVRDTGLGMSEAKMSRLFTAPIANPSIGTANERGLGLGLAICREFVEGNGGAISVESEPGRGSRFHFTLPLADTLQLPKAAI